MQELANTCRKLIAEGGAIGSDLESGLGASEEGEVTKMGVAYGEVVADGYVVVAKVLVKHLVHIVEAVLWVFVLAELSHDDTSDVFKQASHLHIVEHTVHLAHALASILHKQDDA